MQTPFAAIPGYLVQLIEQLRARLSDPDFVARHRHCAGDFTRQRTLTFPVVFLLLLQKTGKSVQRHLREFLAAWLDEPGAGAVTPGAWTQARAKFKHTAFVELNQAVLLPLAYAPEQAAQRRTWRGHRLLGVDGSSLRLPATAVLLRVFGTKTVTNQGGATGTCYPEARPEAFSLPPSGRLTTFPAHVWRCAIDASVAAGFVCSIFRRSHRQRRGCLGAN